MFIFVILAAFNSVINLSGVDNTVRAAAANCWTCDTEVVGQQTFVPKMCGLKLRDKDSICCKNTEPIGWKGKSYCNSELSLCTRPKNQAGALWYTNCKGVLDEANVKRCGGYQVLTPLPEP